MGGGGVMDYAYLKTVADGLISEFKQGTFETGTTTSVDGATEYDAPTVTTVFVEFNGAAFRGVSSQYLNDTSLVSTDLQAIVVADAPVFVGQIVRLDNEPHTVIRVDKIPAIGTVVAKRIFVRQ